MDVRITVCDLNAKIVYMNQAAVLGFHKYGGANLIGKSLFDCHRPESSEKICEMLVLQQVNIYTEVSNNSRRLIRQFPWYEDGIHKVIIEMSFDLPEKL